MSHWSRFSRSLRSVLPFGSERRYARRCVEAEMTAITTSPFWPVPITTVGRSRGGTVVFTRGGKLHVTCILKSTFQFVPDDRMSLTQPEDIVLADIPYAADQPRSIWAPCEVTPFSPHVDVLLTGHACAPHGQPAPSQSVRLAIHRNDTWLLNKTLHVYGDRTDATMVPFNQMAIVYERSYGGPGFSSNPYGTGMTPGSSYPNIVDPLDAAAVAGFGPLSCEMRLARLNAPVLPRFIDEQVLELPAGFEDAFFQYAPSDQLLDSLEGNEWVEVDGMHAQHQRLVSRLPGIRAVAKVYGLYPEKPDGVRTISLRPDMLRIDADALQCSVVFRATIGIRDGRSLQTLRIAAGLETEDITVAHLLTAPPMRGAEPPPEIAPLPSDLDDGSVTGQIVANHHIPVRSAQISISDEVTVDRTAEARAARNVGATRISMSDIYMEDDTVTNERPLTRAEMERIASIAAQLERRSTPEPQNVREEKSTMSLEIDFSEFDSWSKK